MSARPRSHSPQLAAWSIVLSVGALSWSDVLAQTAGVPDNPRGRWEYFYQQRAYPGTTIPAGAYSAAMRTFRAQRVQASSAPPPISGTRWSQIGPERIPISIQSTGRLSAIAVHPTQSNTIYVGGAQGGVWKTTNGGTSWTPTSDNECSLAMGAIAIDPVDPQIVYAGTGEQHFSGDSYYGCGVLRSSDGGATWTALGTSVFQTTSGGARIARVVVDPATAGTGTNTTVLVASDFGVYRSTNSGAGWTQVLAATATDLVLDPTDSQILYTAGYGAGVYQSVNGGATWTLKPNGFPGSGVGRINLAIDPSASQTLYASVHNTSTGGLLGLYKTINGGTNWSLLGSAGVDCSAQCWYDMVLAVHPTNPDTVYFGGVQLYRSVNGGTNFSVIGNAIHVDNHAITFDPADPDVMFVGNDGGIYRSPDAGATWTTLNTNLALTQFYSGISLHPTDPDVVLGGTQDNGTVQFVGSPDFQAVLGGDGGFTGIDFTDPTKRYSETQWSAGSGFSGPRRSDNAGAPGSFVRRVNGITTNDFALFIPPLVMDPTDPAVLYFGTFRIYRTSNSANLWSLVSPDLGGGGGRISAIAPSPSDPNMVYVGTSNGLLQVTTDVGASWSLLRTGLPNRYVSDIGVDADDPLTAYVTVSGFGTGHVFRTTNGGASWTDVSSNLPDIPVNAVALDPGDDNNVFVGTDLGVYVTSDAGGSWSPFSSGLPLVAVFDLAYNPTTGVMIAATHGRGLFSLDMATPVTLDVAPPSRADTVQEGSTTAVPASATISMAGTGSTTAPWTATHGSGAWLSVSTPSGNGSGVVQWSRDPTGLTGGVYVDTITVTSPGALGSPAEVVDTLFVASALTLAVVPESRSKMVTVGSTSISPDSANVTLFGSGGPAANWNASHGGGTWLTLTNASGVGSGILRWQRDPSGLAAGTYVEVIAVTSAGANGSPASVVDTLLVVDPLTVVVAPEERRDTAYVADTAAVLDSATVALAGGGASTAQWSVTRAKGVWLSLNTVSGVGPATLRWTRDPKGLAAGTYADTITITVPGAVGSPVQVVDVFEILPPPITLDGAVSALLRQEAVSSPERDYLDSRGNKDGDYNLGDLLAYLDRLGFDPNRGTTAPDSTTARPSERAGSTTPRAEGGNE